MAKKQTCTRCVMDEDIPKISFDSNGVCTYCHIHDRIEKQYPLDGSEKAKLNAIIERMKKKGKDKKYDCIIGISGGCDSSYLLYLLREVFDLRVLAVTFDNTWSTTIAVENIHNMVKKLDVDLYTYVCDNEEFNDISRSFLKASVPDADIPNDIAIAKTYYMTMDEFDVAYSVCGHSYRTEGTVPFGWTYMDGKYIESVQKLFGTMPLNTFPNLPVEYWLDHLTKKDKVDRVRLLYYMDYRKEDAKALLAKKFGWQWYGSHHFENEYTKFVKSYLLPVKFNIDKRYVEFSALVRSGQKDREEALEELKTPPEVDPKFIDYVIKRLGFTNEEFDAIMKLPIKSFRDYETYLPYFKANKAKFEELMKQGLIPPTFFQKISID